MDSTTAGLFIDGALVRVGGSCKVRTWWDRLNRRVLSNEWSTGRTTIDRKIKIRLKSEFLVLRRTRKRRSRAWDPWVLPRPRKSGGGVRYLT
jgi:hypothetical protein